MRRLFQDYPGLTLVAAVTLVGVHRLVYNTTSWFPDVAHAMANFDQSWSIYLGFAGVVAILAGFASVVSVFALSTESPRFQNLRTHGGSRLEANWVSPIATSFLVSFGSVICAILWVIDQGGLAWWIFEVMLLLAITAAMRILWLFRALVRIIRVSDEDTPEQPPVSLADLQARQRA